MPLPNPSLFQEGLKMMGRCPVCNNRFDPADVKVLEDREDAYLIYIRCRHCQSSIVAVVTAGILGVTSIGLITDLDSEEIMKFKDSRQISSDEVIDLHQLLRQKRTIKEWLK